MIKIYYTTDTHGRILPINYATGATTAQGILACGEEFDQNEENRLIIDVGDTIQGSPFTKFMWEKLDKCIISEVFNKVGYKYITLGNHDFNYGYKALRKYVDNLNAKCIISNLIDKTGGMELYPYYIEELKNGTKVGIVGAVTDFVPLWEKAEHLENFEITDAYEGLKNNLGLIKDKCDLTICLYHGGFECDVESGERLSFTKENIAYKICKELDFDILLTGHQHMPIHGINLYGTFAMQLRHNAVEYGYIEVEGKQIRAKVIRPSKTDIEIPKELIEIEKEVNEWLEEPIGTFNEEIKVQDKLTMALNGSLLANFCNQVQLEFTKADFSCTALGNNLIGFDRNVTIRDIVAAYQFPNTIKVLGVTYEILKLALERVAEYYDVEDGEIKISNKFLKPKITHYNYDFFSGFHYRIDLSRPIGDRITIMDKLDRPKVYTLCMSNYRATGTGEYDFYTKCPIIREYSIDTQELIIDYIKKRKYVEIDNTKYFDIKF